MATKTDGPLGRSLGRGKEAEVFELGTLAAKIYGTAAGKQRSFREAMNLAVAESLGLPVPAARRVQQLGGRWALVMDRVGGPSFAELLESNPEVMPECIEQMVTLQLRVHACRPVGLTCMKTRLINNIRATVALDEPKRTSLLADVNDMPDGESLCHGDFHPKNLLGSLSHAKIIDWLDACQGDPAADVCRSYLLLSLYAPQLAAPYLRTYTRRGGITGDCVSRWLPFIAAARLAEGVTGEMIAFWRWSLNARGFQPTKSLAGKAPDQSTGTAIPSNGPYC